MNSFEQNALLYTKTVEYTLAMRLGKRIVEYQREFVLSQCVATIDFEIPLGFCYDNSKLFSNCISMINSYCQSRAIRATTGIDMALENAASTPTLPVVELLAAADELLPVVVSTTVVVVVIT